MHEQLRDRLTGSGLDPAALGQDVALAAPLAQRWGTVGRLVQELRRTSTAHVRDALTGDVLGHDSPLAAVHGTRYPIVQGPMTRVSDRAAFAPSVAQRGRAAVPGTRPDVWARGRLPARAHAAPPWRTGRGASALLGFVPAELRRASSPRSSDTSPPFALIAGGRPAQAAAARGGGIATVYLHVAVAGPARALPRGGARRSSSRVASAAATSGRARASCSGTQMDCRAASEALAPRTWPRAGCCSPAASTTRAPPPPPRLAGPLAARAPRRRPDGHRLPVHRGGREAGAVTPSCSRRRPVAAAAPCCWRPAAATPPAAP